MSDQEIRELELWVAEHVMLYKRGHPGRCKMEYWQPPPYKFGVIPVENVPRYGRDAAPAMDVLKKCGQKEVRGVGVVCCSFSHGSYSTISEKGHWNVGRLDTEGRWRAGEVANALTIELAICLYAKKLFTK